ncbi:MAG: ParB N-terminal domain-containing protein [Nocardiopsaceae bacterium]|nr:ParB N-terminal domain-containing protein [Nocardiopsaceae bacterium]
MVGPSTRETTRGGDPGEERGDIRRELARLAVPIDTITPHPGNYRRGDLTMIAESLRLHGQYSPVIVQAATGRILRGTNTWRAARDRLGWTEIAAQYIDVDDTQAAKVLAIDNATSDSAVTDLGALTSLLADIAAETELTGTGYTTGDLDNLLTTLEAHDEPTDTLGPDADPDPAAAVPPRTPLRTPARTAAPIQRAPEREPHPATVDVGLTYSPGDYTEMTLLVTAIKDVLGDGTLTTSGVVLRALRTLAAACDIAHMPDTTITVRDLLQHADTPPELHKP